MNGPCRFKKLLLLFTYLTLPLSSRLSSMICFTNATSPPTTMLSCGAAVLTDFGSGRSSDRLVNIPQASRLLPKNGGLHMQKSYVSPTSTTPHSFVFEDTCNTVDRQDCIVICQVSPSLYLVHLSFVQVEFIFGRLNFLTLDMV